jgi:hypothetical protein
MDEIKSEFQKELERFFSDSSSRSAPPIPTSRSESELLNEMIDIKEKYLASQRNSEIVESETRKNASETRKNESEARKNESEARKNESEAKKNERDSILYPMFVGFGLIAVTFGTLNMGVGTDKAFAMISTEIRQLSKSIVDSAEGLAKSADGAATGIQGFAMSAIYSCGGYLYSVFGKKK